ncbi:hypothetical protein MXB_4774 [Myxobolus squamalis]|nr:hypothetical protein MXB_4774 [Myxobolus squamalis]
MDFGGELEQYFGTTDFYDILGVSRNSSEDQIKKGYRKLALKVHPDRVEQHLVDEANKKFQALSRISSTLLDPEKKSIYDETGLTEELLLGFDENTDWYQFWRGMFPAVTKENIKNAELAYRGSQEELNDIKNSYIKNSGDILKIINDTIFTSISDIDRVKNIIDQMIENNEIPVFEMYKNYNQTKIKSAKRKSEKESAEAEQMAKNLNVKTSDCSAHVSLNRYAAKAKYDNMIDSLATKYIDNNVKRRKNVVKKKK